tara:strand:+ start:192 stop:362 length:171 start_codon:yes stop_codon:yes gene_type:complete
MSKVSYSELLDKAISDIDNVRSVIKSLDDFLIVANNNKDFFKKYGLEITLNKKIIF